MLDGFSNTRTEYFLCTHTDEGRDACHIQMRVGLFVIYVFCFFDLHGCIAVTGKEALCFDMPDGGT